MQPVTIAIVMAALVFVFGRVFATRMLMARYQDGRMTGRTALMLLAAVTVVPYLLITTWAVIRAPESWWIWLILLVASWPILVLPVAALYQQAKANRHSDGV